MNFYFQLVLEKTWEAAAVFLSSSTPGALYLQGYSLVFVMADPMFYSECLLQTVGV